MSRMKIIKILSCLFLLFVELTSAQKCQHKTPGILQLDYAAKLDFLEGTDVRVPCSLTNTTFVSKDNWTEEVNSSNLRFKRFGVSELLGEESELVVREGDDRVVFVMKNATETEFSLMCMGSTTLRDGSKVQLPGCIASIAVGYVPKKIENFSCQSNMFKSLSCKWTNPPNKVKTNYTVEVMRGVTEHYMPCPANETKPSSCLWTLNSSPSYDNKITKARFRVTGSNSLGSQKWLYEFDHASIVKLSPVTRLQYSSLSPRNVSISWNPPAESDHGGWKQNLSVMFYVQIGCEYCEDPKTFETSDRYLAQNLTPNTAYNITVQCKTNMTTRFDLYSDPTSIAFKSPKEKPDGPPLFFESAFQYRLFKDSRTITLLFEEVPPAHWNDDKFFYLIQVCAQREPCSNMTVYSSNVDLEDLSQQKRYDIEIWSGNSLGLSQDSSRITIGTQEELLPPPLEITALLEMGSVRLTWKDSRSATAQNTEAIYTVFWCNSYNQQSCNGTSYSRRVGNVSEAVISIENPRDYIFGAALSEENGRTSGTAWSTCEIQPGSQIGQVRELEALPETDTSLNLRWRIGCGFSFKQVVKYQIEYCRVDHLREEAVENSEVCQHPRYHNVSGACLSRNITLDGESNYSLSGLEMGEVYRIVIRALDSTTDRFAPDSKAVCAIARALGMSVYTIVAIAVGSALALIVVICSFYLITRRIRKEHDIAKTMFGTAKLPRQLKSDIRYTDHKQRVVEMNGKNMNGVKHDQITDETTATMLSDLNVKGSHSSLDKLIMETSTAVIADSPVEPPKDLRRSPNLNREPKTTAERRPAATPSYVPRPLENGYVPHVMPPYTQLGLSAAHYPTNVEQPGNTGYSQLSVTHG